MDGPRALLGDEWEQLNAVVGTVFRDTMFEHYPQLFNEANRANLRVVAVDGQVVCHVGMTQRPATLLGCTIRVACIGAVATLSEYRQRGYATEAFANAVAKARADGVDVMLISGGRGLYQRAGSREVGQDSEFTIEPSAGPRLQALANGIEVVPAEPDHIDAMRALYASEPVRFLRPREDWEMAFECGHVMNQPTEFLLVRRGAHPVAYLLLAPPWVDGRAYMITEFAGERAALACALGQVTAERQLRLVVHVLGTDRPFKVLLTEAGLTAERATSHGTLLVVNFEQLMERIRPLLAERIGTTVAAQLSFRSDGEQFAISQGAEEIVVVGRGDLAQYLFGAADSQPAIRPRGSSDLAATIARALPLPALWYGINFV